MMHPLALLAAIALGWAGPGRGSPVVDGEVRAVVDGINGLGFDLLGTLRGRHGNLAVAPSSLAVALAMAAEGARGETAAEMTRALRLPRDVEARRRGFRALTTRFAADPATSDPKPVRVESADALWAERGDPFLPAYLAVAHHDYRAEIRAADFRGDPDGSRRSINAWVDERTRRLVPELIPPGAIGETTSLVLVDALALKAVWASPFHSTSTQTQDFRTGPGRSVPVPMLRQTHTYRHAKAEGDGLQVVSIPYRGDAMAMVVLLPDAADGLARVEAGLTAAKVDGWLASARPERVFVEIPRFSTATALELTTTLAGLGMPSAFGPSADFSGIDGTRRLSISAVAHQAVVKVDEEGTEAAAATGVMMKRAMMAAPAPKPPIPFRADHPFLYLIRDAETGLILFLGRVADPSR